MEIKNQSDINLLKNFTLAINCKASHRATHRHMIYRASHKGLHKAPHIHKALWTTHKETSCRATWEANQEANWEVD